MRAWHFREMHRGVPRGAPPHISQLQLTIYGITRHAVNACGFFFVSPPPPTDVADEREFASVRVAHWPRARARN